MLWECRSVFTTGWLESTLGIGRRKSVIALHMQSICRRIREIASGLGAAAYFLYMNSLRSSRLSSIREWWRNFIWPATKEKGTPPLRRLKKREHGKRDATGAKSTRARKSDLVEGRFYPGNRVRFRCWSLRTHRMHYRHVLISESLLRERRDKEWEAAKPSKFI